MKMGFNEDAFMAYLEYTFPNVFAGNGSPFVREMVANLIEYAHKHEQISKDQFCIFLSDLIPEVEMGEVAAFVEMGEVAAFMDDDCLTASYGIAEKRQVMAEKNIRVEVIDGITHVYVDGKELYL